MATLAELQSEPWWGREIITSPMVGLGLELRAAYGTGALSIGIKGNERHLSGGHRSQEWLKNSAYCTNRTYATQSGLGEQQPRMVAALDFTPGVWGSADNRAKMKVLTKRVIDAMKAGQLDELDECFGTLDGVTVTGWNNDGDRTITADSSHLDHIHLRFDRRYADDNGVMSRTSAIMLGKVTTMATTLTPEDRVAIWTHDLADGSAVDPAYKVLNRAAGNAAAALANASKAASLLDSLTTTVQTLTAALAAVDAKVAGLALPASAPVDPAALKAVLLDPEVLAALARAVNDDAARRQAE